MKGLETELRRRVRGEVRFDPLYRALYATDASLYQIAPAGVVVPMTEEDVRAAVSICTGEGVPVLARGAGTSLAGQAVTEGVVVDLSRHLTHILEIDGERRIARVEPGVVLDQLNDAVAPRGLRFGPDVATSSRATLGGMIGNNSAGSRSIVYGKTVDHVESLRVLLADGSVTTFGPLGPEELEARCGAPTLDGRIHKAVRRIVGENAREIDERFPRILRRVSGYNLDEFARRPGEPWNLSRLVVGSEGTLAIVLEARVGLVPLPERTTLVLLGYRDVVAACAAVPDLLELKPSAVELLDRFLLSLAREAFVPGDPGAILFVEFPGEAPAIPGRGDAVVLGDPDAQKRIWKLRKDAVGLLQKLRGKGKAVPFVEDTAVPVARLAEYVTRFQRIVADHDAEAVIYAHASAGCLHIRPILDLRSPEGRGKMLSIARRVADLVAEFGGAMTGEHGDGIARSQWIPRLFGARIAGAFAEVKRAFDPEWRFNPGKIVGAPDMDAHLRPPSRPVPTLLAFDEGIAEAADLCNGTGACRKLGEGAMCPSYRATRDELHTTRGRANALRAALSGSLRGLGDPALLEALDLCLACKACKTECPAGVDLAKLKVEALAHVPRENRKLRDRLFAEIDRALEAGARFPRLANLVASIARLPGIHRDRPLPRLARVRFTLLAAGFPADGPAGRVALFPDTFTEFLHPGVGLAAMRVLRAAGYGVTVTERLCCGRAALSKGFVPEARARALALVYALLPYAARRIPVVALEPSCALTVRDDYRDLLPEHRREVEIVAGNLLLAEEWLAREKPRLLFREKPRSFLVHTHCYQKALGGAEAVAGALALIPGARVETIDAGCCGMAGAFGFEAEHHEISKAIAEERLLPAIRGRERGTLLVAGGTSCRQQIRHLEGETPLHPVEALAEALLS